MNRANQRIANNNYNKLFIYLNLCWKILLLLLLLLCPMYGYGQTINFQHLCVFSVYSCFYTMHIHISMCHVRIYFDDKFFVADVHLKALIIRLFAYCLNCQITYDNAFLLPFGVFFSLAHIIFDPHTNAMETVL